jgi:hypothetical protein
MFYSNIFFNELKKSVMKKIYLVIIFLVVVMAKANSQITFQKTIGGTGADGAHFIQQTFDGGYIIAGATSSFGVDSGDAYLVKTDLNANIIWSKTFGGIKNEYFNDVKQTNDSGYVMVGRSKSFGQGITDILVVKTDKNGNLMWAKIYGGAVEQNGYSIQQTTDGGYVLCGWTTSFTGGIYTIRLDGSGNITWTKIYGGFFDAGYHIEQTTDGGFIITGDNFSSGEISLIKTDSAGTPVWAKTYGAPGGNGFSVHQTSDGGYVVFGTSASQDLYLIKTDSTGGLLWSKTYGGTSGEEGFAVQQTTDGGYILTGGTNSFGLTGNAVYLVRTNGSGNVTWSKTFGGTGFDYGMFVQQTADGGFIVAGSTDFFGSGGDDMYIIKTDSSGNSGCNEGNPSTIETTVATNVSDQNTNYFTGGTSSAPSLNIGNGGIITTLCPTVFIQDVIPSNSLQLSPNPVTDYLTINLSDNILKAQINIYNFFGEIESYSIAGSEINNIDVRKLIPGIYILEIFSVGKRTRQKFVKQ